MTNENYEALESKLAAKCRWARDEGSPVSGQTPEHWAEVAAIARRRWVTFTRRSKNKAANREARVEDVARGLCDTFENGGMRMAGALMTDYQWLAEQLADILHAELGEPTQG